jgi:hypothetical protein
MNKILKWFYFGSKRHLLHILNVLLRKFISAVNKITTKIKKQIIIAKENINYINHSYNKKNRKIIINSHVNYYSKTVFRLLETLIGHGIEKNSICVVVGGDTNKHFTSIDNVEFIFVDNNSFDLTALIAYLELGLNYESIFLMHDTIEINSIKFKKFFYCYPLKRGQTVSIGNLDTKKFSMNIGFYSREAIMRFRSDILKRKNIDYSAEKLQMVKDLGVVEEDLVFKLNYENHTYAYAEGIDYNTEVVNYFGSQRLREDYFKIGLIKYKANFARKTEYVINI